MNALQCAKKGEAHIEFEESDHSFQSELSEEHSN